MAAAQHATTTTGHKRVRMGVTFLCTRTGTQENTVVKGRAKTEWAEAERQSVRTSERESVERRASERRAYAPLPAMRSARRYDPRLKALR